MNFLFTCGGTAGHINPAIAIAERVRELMPDCGVLFVGADGMMETKRVPEAGYDLETVKITNFQRSIRPDKLMHNLRTIKNIATSTMAAKRIIRDFAPDVALGTGGYVCYPVLRACGELGIPAALHESNAVPGLTTRMLSRRVDRLFVGYEDSVRVYRTGNVVFTGTPVRLNFTNMSKHVAKSELGIPGDVPLVLSVWGSLGSEHMNGVMTGLIARAAKERGSANLGRGAANPEFYLIHATGERGYSQMIGSLGMRAAELKQRGLEVRDYIHDMPKVMAAADLVLCRAGASTLSELAVAGKPAVLIPSPNVTNNHQEKNARVLESAGAAKVYTEGSFDAESLLKIIGAVLRDKSELTTMSMKMRGLATPGAVDAIVEILLELTQKTEG